MLTIVSRRQTLRSGPALRSSARLHGRRELSSTPARRTDTQSSTETALEAGPSRITPARRLSIANLPLEATESDLRAVLEPYGRIESIRFHHTRESARRDSAHVVFDTVRAHVIFDTVQEAMRAREAEITLPCRLTLDYDPDHEPAPPSQRLYIGNLSYWATQDELREALEPFGAIQSLRIMYLPDGKSRGIAFVFFEDMDAAQRAIAADIVLYGRKLLLQNAIQNRAFTTGVEVERPRGTVSRTLYVGNIPFASTEEEIRELFAQYGEIRAIRIGRDKMGSFRGFCHVEFSREAEAAAAISDPLNMDGRLLMMDFARPK
ncbi:Nucleic acid-binding protein [Mycena chlorophos]|uniref:Nucleic acid-binding protein n=1 Tax=Mycena chlorophos TaxID=658473 RepID=A0A8H6S6J0_MYCCL|nr:Nucleic acid-binding protein [Mycena chlorophos]